MESDREVSKEREGARGEGEILREQKEVEQ